ncbi:MAG: hypothetical protein QOG94_2888 [Solirubrobacteraceae bacterium]|jgi:hypothetical protein|nr:hypothetical protein [Solirubrobacteraceae bacterium]MEA2139044.1 hypothetical protein [Solirubrobacteraceae bacterium]
MNFRCAAIAVALLASLLAAAPASAALPCSKAAIGRIVHLDRYESITAVRCADLTGDGRLDVAYSKAGGGSGGDVQWGIVYARGGARRIARFAGHTHYADLRIRGRRVLIDSPRYRPADPNCCPSAGTRTEAASWNGHRFVKRLVAIRRPRAMSSAPR